MSSHAKTQRKYGETKLPVAVDCRGGGGAGHRAGDCVDELCREKSRARARRERAAAQQRAGAVANCERSAAVSKTSRSTSFNAEVFRTVHALRLILRTQPRPENILTRARNRLPLKLRELPGGQFTMVWPGGRVGSRLAEQRGQHGNAGVAGRWVGIGDFQCRRRKI